MADRNYVVLIMDTDGNEIAKVRVAPPMVDMMRVGSVPGPEPIDHVKILAAASMTVVLPLQAAGSPVAGRSASVAITKFQEGSMWATHALTSGGR